MPAVSNTSPITNLAVIGRLDLLRQQLGSVLIPPAVHAEVLRMPDAAGLSLVQNAISEGWIELRSLASPIPDDLKALDAGESEALALALETKAPRLVIDESIGRQHAARLGLPHVGLLGILRYAKNSGEIDSLRAEIAVLRKKAHFFISDELEGRLLASVGE